MRLTASVDDSDLLAGTRPDAVDHMSEEPSTLDEQLSYFESLTVALEAQIPSNVPRGSKNRLAMQSRLGFFRSTIAHMRATMADRSQNHCAELAYFIQWFCTELANFDHGFQKYYPKRTEGGGPVIPKYVCAIRDALAEGFMHHVYPLRATLDGREWRNERLLDDGNRSVAEDHPDDPNYSYHPSIILDPTSIPAWIRRFGREQDFILPSHVYAPIPVLSSPRVVEPRFIRSHGRNHRLLNAGLTVRFTPPPDEQSALIVAPAANEVVAAAIEAVRDAVTTEKPFVVVSNAGNRGEGTVVSLLEEDLPTVDLEDDQDSHEETPAAVPAEITASVPALVARQGITRKCLWIAGVAAVVFVTTLGNVMRSLFKTEPESAPAAVAVVERAVPVPNFSINPAFTPPRSVSQLFPETVPKPLESVEPVASVAKPVHLWTVAQQNSRDSAAATIVTNDFLASRQAECDALLAGLDERRKTDAGLFSNLQSLLTDTGYGFAVESVPSADTIQELLDAQGPDRDIAVQQIAARFLSPTQEVAWGTALQVQLATGFRVDIAQ